MFYPLHIINLEILKVMNKTKIFLNLEIFKKILFLVIIILGSFFSIEILLWFMVLHSFISFVINSLYSKLLINLGFFEQVKIMIKPIIVVIISASPLGYLRYVWKDEGIVSVSIALTIIMVLVLALSHLFNLRFINLLRNLNLKLIDTRYKTIFTFKRGGI